MALPDQGMRMVGVDVELQGGFQRGQSFLRQPAVLQQSLAPDNEIIGRKDIQKGGKGLPAPADVLRRVPVAGIGLDPLKKDGIGQLLPTVFRRAVFPAAKHGFNIADVADPVVALHALGALVQSGAHYGTDEAPVLPRRGRAVRRFAQHGDPWRGNAVFRAYIRKKMERGLRLQARFHAFQCGHGETPSPPYKSRLGRSNGAKGNRVRNRRAAVGAE